jgi:hypothetical protein
MASKNPCGHPADWVLTLNAGGKRFTYCIGCMVKKLGLRHLQTYDNPYIDVVKAPEPTVGSTASTVVKKKSK